MPALLRNAWLCFLVLAVGCAKTTTPEQGTNTNWLQTCDSEADCDDELSCVCGVCTKACTGDTQCDAVHAATSCQALDEVACGASNASMSACLEGCDSSSDCTSLEDGRCVAGLCVPRMMSVLDAGTDASMLDASTNDASTNDASALDATMPPPDTGLLNPFFVLGRDGNNVVITEAYTACTQHHQCVLVSIACDACCAQGAIHDDHADTYETNFAAACADIPNEGCPCDPALMVAACRDDHCIALDAFNNCYSPNQNLDLAYVTDARGCEGCEIGQAICVDGAALVCEGLDSNPPTTRWYAVEDGPCGEPTPDPTCADGEVRATPDACLADFMTCYELPSGEYCGFNP